MSLEVDLLKQDAQASNEVKKNTLSLQEVRDLCAEMAALERKIDGMESELIDLKEKHKKFSEETIPDALTQIGLKDMTLDDDTYIGLEQLVATSISEANKPAAHAWLRKEGFEDLIKNEVVVSFGKGEDEDAAKLMKDIKSREDINFGAIEQQEKVHASTLKAWVKTRLKDGLTVPKELFGLFTGQRAVIGKKKKK